MTEPGRKTGVIRYPSGITVPLTPEDAVGLDELVKSLGSTRGSFVRKLVQIAVEEFKRLSTRTGAK